ncbi:hypothetical protein O9992_28695 [Vibrio lentus]|nr:hypothetical protein [Vibrio lentus]
MNARAFYKYREEPTYRTNESEKWKAQTAGMVFQPSNAEESWSLRIGVEKSFYESELYTFQYDNSGSFVGSQANDFDNKSQSVCVQFNDSRHFDEKFDTLMIRCRVNIMRITRQTLRKLLNPRF